ncbi:MAG: hypothetical protein U9N86_10895 [Bacteroidota bacterium]|nr:hypothetical protein [Bacteroidota bacterium]
MKISVNAHILMLIVIFASSAQSCRKGNYLIEEHLLNVVDDGSGTGTVTWTADNTYILDGFVFVNDGQILTIEPGTVIHSRTGRAERASALIVARGGKIIAEGTRDKPIVFTVEGDDLEGSVPLEAKGLWGGIIILGNAPIYTESGEASIEGVPFYEPRGIYGGYDANDNSGILKYVSIRHGGSNIGEGNEINGLTLAAVGNNTTIDYVEIISNEDDGLEIFGGTVNIKHIFVAFCGDDAFDYDLGYTGKGQFLVGIQQEGLGDRLFENGGNIHPGEETAHPVFYNLTLMGQGYNTHKPAVSFLNNAGGEFYNSLIINQDLGIEIEKIDGRSNSYQQWQAGNIKFEDSWFFNVANNMSENVFFLTGGFSLEDQQKWSDYFEGGNNQIKSAEIGCIQNKYFIRPDLVSWGQNHQYPGSWFDPVEFKGAMGSVNWAKSWTLFDREGLFGN